MNENIINWDELPEYINKDQLYRICHISKSTALYLLKSGKIPCEYNGKKTCCYRIKKEDVITYLKERKVFPESYSAPAGWYGGHYDMKMPKDIPPIILEDMHEYYKDYLLKYPDVLKVNEVALMTNYRRSTIGSWCKNGHLQAFLRNNAYHIPKIYLVDFFCSEHFRMITRKSDWHIKMLRNYADWKKGHKRARIEKSDK